MKATQILLFTDPSRCQPCKLLETLIQGATFDLPITTITTGLTISQEDKQRQEKYGIRSIPHLIFADDSGNEIGRMSGYSPESIKKIKDKIKELNS